LSHIFADPLALALSFRKHSQINSNFLKEDGADIDFEAIDALVKLSKSTKSIESAIMKGIVSLII